MRGLIALAVLGLVAFATTPVLAECSDGHKKMTETSSPTTVTETATTTPTKSGS